MLPEIKRRFTRLEQIWQQYNSIIDNASDVQRHYKPAPDAWNMLQVVQHIMASEGGTLNFMNKRPPLQPTLFDKIGNALRSALLTVALKSTIKFKAPNVPGLSPETTNPWEESKPKWEQIHQGLQQYLEQFPASKMGYVVFKHPAAGKLNMLQTMDFLVEHAAHHLQQINRLKADEKFPQW